MARGYWDKVRDIRYAPSLVNFSFIDKEGNDISEIKVINSEEPYEIFANLIFANISLNSEFYSDYSISRYLNFCIYEVNKTGKGYRILGYLDYEIEKALLKAKNFGISVPLIDANIKDLPYEVDYLGVENPKKEKYNFLDTYIAIKVFHSSEKIEQLAELDQFFYSIEDTIVDAKLPFITSEEL